MNAKDVLALGRVVGGTIKVKFDKAYVNV